MINLFSFTFSISVAVTKKFPFVLIATGRSGNPIGQNNSYARSWITTGGPPDWLNSEWGKELIEKYKKEVTKRSGGTGGMGNPHTKDKIVFGTGRELVNEQETTPTYARTARKDRVNL